MIHLCKNKPKALDFEFDKFNVVRMKGSDRTLIACRNPGVEQSGRTAILFLGDCLPAYSSLRFLKEEYEIVKHIPMSKLDLVEVE